MAFRRRPRGKIEIRFDLLTEEQSKAPQLDLSKYTKISQSRISRWQTCKRAHHYAFNEKLERKVAPVALYKGKAIHEMIEDLIYGRDWKKTLQKYIDEYNKLFEEEKEAYGDLPNDLRIIMENYQKRYENDGLTYLELNGKKAEHDFAIEIAKEPCNHCGGDGFDDNTNRACKKCDGTGERGIAFVGKIDAVVQDKLGRVWLMEHKTFKKLPDEDFRWTNQQANFYTWVMPQIGFPKPDGVLWDYIRTKVPAIPPTLKSGGLTKRKDIDTTYDTYYQAIIDNGLDPEDYKDILESLEGNEENFYRRIFLPTRNDIILPIVEDMINTAKEIHYLGEVLKTRNLGRHCSYCSFKQICQVELMGGDSEFIKKTEYQPSTYHVNATDGEEE